MRRYIIGFITVSLLFACSKAESSIDKLQLRDEVYPKGFAKELQTNLDFFLDGVGVDPESKVPFDTIFVKDGVIDPQYYVNTTEIGFYLNILVEAEKAGTSGALTRIEDVISVLENTPTWKGLYYWPYDIVDGELHAPDDPVIPAVDNANLAFSLARVAGAYLDSTEPKKLKIVDRIDMLLNGQKEAWSLLYDESKGLIAAGWDPDENQALSYYIDRKANESRLAPLWAALITKDMGTNAVPQKAFTNMELYTEEYNNDELTLNPILTWDGAYFQAMLPFIFLDERQLIPNFKMFEDMTTIQKSYAEKHNIPMISSSATIDDGYAAFGIAPISEAHVKHGNEVHDEKTGTPHATALSYMIDPKYAVSALLQIKSNYPKIETPYGWYDAVDHEGNMTAKIISLDQGMFVGAFIHKEIQQDVKTYLDHKGYSSDIEKMYQSFVPNN